MNLISFGNFSCARSRNMDQDGTEARRYGRWEGRAMKDDSIELPGTDTPTGYVRATLAIPEHAVRVIASPPETLTQRNIEAVTGLPVRTFLRALAAASGQNLFVLRASLDALMMRLAKFGFSSVDIVCSISPSHLE